MQFLNAYYSKTDLEKKLVNLNFLVKETLFNQIIYTSLKLYSLQEDYIHVYIYYMYIIYIHIYIYTHIYTYMPM
jgi:nucleoside recognition membrane protein YjiH